MKRRASTAPPAKKAKVAPKAAPKPKVAPKPVAKKEQPKPKVVVDPMVQKVATISAALEQSDAPKTVCEMFTNMLPHAFVQPRHDMQERVLEMVSTQLMGVQQTLQNEVDEAETKVASVDQERCKREAAIVEAESTLESKIAEFTAATERFDQIKVQTKSAEDALAEAEKSQKQAETDSRKHLDQKTKFEAAVDLKQKLEAGEIEECNLRREAESLHAQLKPLITDENMLNALKLSLSKPTAVRGPFDTMVLEQVADTISKAVAEVTALIEGAEPLKVERAAAVETCRLALDESRKERIEAELGHSDADVAKKDAQSTLKDAKSHLSSFDGEIKQMSADLKEANANLQALNDGALTIFENLRLGREEEVAKEEEAAVTEEVEMADTPSEPQPEAEQPQVQAPMETEPAPQEVMETEPVKEAVVVDKIMETEQSNPVAALIANAPTPCKV